MNQFLTTIPHAFVKAVLRDGSDREARVLLAISYLDSWDTPITVDEISRVSGLVPVLVEQAIDAMWPRAAFSYHFLTKPTRQRTKVAAVVAGKETNS